MVEERRPLARLSYYFVGTLFAAFAGFISIGLMTAPVWAGLSLTGSSDLLGHIVLALLGWAAFLSQKIVIGGFEEETERDLSSDYGWVVATALSIIGVLYYNAVLVFVVIGAQLLMSAGFAALSAGFAVLYPIYEMWTMEEGSLISIAGLLSLVIASGMMTAHIAQNISPKNIRLDEYPLQFFGGNRLV